MAAGAIAASTQSSSTARTVGRLLMWSCGGQEKRKQSFRKVETELQEREAELQEREAELRKIEKRLQ